MESLTFIGKNLMESQVEGRRMLFHVPTTSLFEVDAVGGELLDLFRARRQVSRDEIQDHFDGRYPVDEVVGTLQEFLELDILNDGRPLKPERPAVKLEQVPLTTIVLSVNTGCNLSCTYCYKEDLASPKAGKRMSFETAVQSIEMLLKESPDRDRYNIVFFGGEPLSNMPLIRQVVDYAEERFKGLGKAVDFTLTTNATLLTEEIVDYLDAHRFGITISMDGPPDLHDKNRLTVGGQGSYAVVAAKSRMLLERYRSRPVGARVTLTAGVVDAVRIWDHLKNDLGFHEVGFSPVTSGEMTMFNLNEPELAEVFDNMTTLGRKYLEGALMGRNIGFSNMHQMMSDLYEGTSKALPCGAGVGMLAVDDGGDLHLCHRFSGSGMDTFGSVTEGVDVQGISDFVAARADREGRDCASCSIRNLCAGGCYHESYARYEDPTAPTLHYCDLMRRWVAFGIDVYTRILTHNPAFFENHIQPRRAFGK